jgi:hypothetical protein
LIKQSPLRPQLASAATLEPTGAEFQKICADGGQMAAADGKREMSKMMELPIVAAGALKLLAGCFLSAAASR